MSALGSLLLWALQIYNLILLARVLLSWFPQVDRYHPVVRFLYDVTEPVLRPVREMLPQTMGIDFSPLIVFLLLSVLSRVVASAF